jgi:hypothetical protein
MAAPVTAAFPPGLDLPGGYTVRFAALSPTDGSAVSGVTVSAATILTDTAAINVDAGGGTTADIEPLWVPLPNNLLAPAAAPLPGAAVAGETIAGLFGSTPTKGG